MRWALAKLIARSWLTWSSVLRGSRRSLLFPTRNLGRQMRQKEKHHSWQNKCLKTSKSNWKDSRCVMNSVFWSLPGDFLSKGVLPTLFCPGSQAAEAGWACDIIYKEHSVDVTIVVLYHGLSETLLSCCVPQLELVVREKNKGRGKRKWMNLKAEMREKCGNNPLTRRKTCRETCNVPLRGKRKRINAIKPGLSKILKCIAGK